MRQVRILNLSISGFGAVVLSLFLTQIQSVMLGSYDDKIVIFERLGDLPGSLFQSIALDVSADGSVIVGEGDSGYGGNQFEGFRWVDGVMTGMKDVRVVSAVSDDGSVMVGRRRDPITEGWEWVRLEDSIWTGLGDLSPTALSGDGLVVAGAGYHWKDGILTVLESLSNSRYLNPAAVNYDGSVIVGTTDGYGGIGGGDGAIAFRWLDGVIGELPPLPGDTLSEAFGVSSDGSIIVGRSINMDPSIGVTPSVWIDGSISALEPLPGALYVYGEALHVSGDGQIIVGQCDVNGQMEIAFWSKDDGYAPVSVRSILEAYGIDLTGVMFRSLRALSSDGTTIVGDMEDEGVHGTQAFRIRITDAQSVDPLIGGTPIDGLPGWFLSDWFGYYNTDFDPWLFHAEHGFIFRYPESTNESTYFYDHAMGAWWWTNETNYPSLYAFNPPADNGGTDIESAWLWYFEGPNGPRSFVVLDGPSVGTYLFFHP